MGIVTEAPAAWAFPSSQLGSRGTAKMFEVTIRDGTAVVVLSGKLVQESCAAFSAVIDGVLATNPSTVVLDLAGMTVVDTFGVDIVLTCRRRASSRGAALHIRDPSELVRRLLELTADDRVVDLTQIPAWTTRSRHA
jgi:anti-anti-sigma factor